MKWLRCTIPPFATNREFYNYLVSLAATFRDRDAVYFASLVESASRQASGMSTEFLSESRIVLRQVLAEANGLLVCDERKDLTDTLAQLDDALDNVDAKDEVAYASSAMRISSKSTVALTFDR